MFRRQRDQAVAKKLETAEAERKRKSDGVRRSSAQGANPGNCGQMGKSEIPDLCPRVLEQLDEEQEVENN